MCVEVVFLLLAHVYVRVMQPSNLQVKRVTWPYCARHSTTVQVMQQPTERHYRCPASQRFVHRKPTKEQLRVTRNALRPELFTFVRSQLSTLNYSYIPCSSQLRFNCVRITQNCPLKFLNVNHPLQTRRKYMYNVKYHLKSVISGFHRAVDENWVLPGYYATSSGNFLPTFRDNLKNSCGR